MEICASHDMDCLIEHGLISEIELINQLMKDLAAPAGQVRQRARQRLVEMGEVALDPLMRATLARNGHIVWEAVKALSEMADPRAVSALIRALDDPWGSISWLAAEGLVNIGRPTVIPLLEALAHHSDSLHLHQGAYHVLRQLAVGDLEPILQPVLSALTDIEPRVEVPLAASKALHVLRGIHMADQRKLSTQAC